MKNRIFERGSHHLVLVVVAVVALVGILGFVGYNAWQKQQSNAGDKNTVGRKPTSDSQPHGISCTATFDGVKTLENGHKRIYGKVTVKNKSNTAKKVAITLRQQGLPETWLGEKGWYAKEVKVPAHGSHSNNWKSIEMLTSNKSYNYKVVAALYPHETAETDIGCKSKGFKLQFVPGPHG